MEHMIRACLIALRLAESAAIDDAERGVVYYSGLLAWVGCHTDAYEQAKWLGDDLAVKRDAHYGYDFGKAGPAAAFLVKHVGGAGLPVRQRVLTGVQFPGGGRRALAALAENHYLATDQLAAELGLGEQVRVSLRQSYERWDGKGAYGLRGDQIAMSSRLINLADVVEVFRRTGGIDAALAVARERSGTQFDPDLVDMFCQQAPLIFGDLDQAASWDLVIDAEPSLAAVVSGIELDDALSAVGEFAELKSPWLMGHARGVAELAADAARSGGLPQADVPSLRRAAFVHDIGRLGVPNTIWDKPAGLTRPGLVRVRLHPYLTERMLSFSAGLAPLGVIAGQHHERLDGSGYPRGLSGDAISTAGRILAAADNYHALTEARPHRLPRSAADAAAELRAGVSSGQLDGAAVDAVLRAAGHRVRRRREWPAGLTAREVEIVRLLVRGLTAKAIAGQLVISPKTASSHIEHIYAKTGVSNRAQLSLFALKHGLMAEPNP